MGAIWVWKTLFKALASPSLIALSSKDPIITAFQLSDELKRLAAIESQFKEEYKKLRKIVQEFAVGLVEQARTSYELEVFLNYNPGGTPWKPGTYKMLIRVLLRLEFQVAHPILNVTLATDRSKIHIS